MAYALSYPEWQALIDLAHTLSPHDHLHVMQLVRESLFGMAHLSGLPPTVVIWGSARLTPTDPSYLAARETASLLARHGYGILTGGGPGLMEAANRGAREGGAISIGLPIQLAREECPNAFLDVAIPFTSFAPRKHLFLQTAQAFVIFPGGFGTLDELGEVLAAIQTQQLARRPIVLYGRTFWEGLLIWLRDTLVRAGTIDADDFDLLTVAETPEEVVAALTEPGHQIDQMEDESETQAIPSAAIPPAWAEVLP
jgi:uncharacterized protein (TIGR00730 family)